MYIRKSIDLQYVFTLTILEYKLVLYIQTIFYWETDLLILNIYLMVQYNLPLLFVLVVFFSIRIRINIKVIIK